MPKTSKAEYEKRLLVIGGWIAENYLPQIIDQQIFTKGWCESERQARRMRKAAWQIVKENQEEYLGDLLNKTIFDLEHRKRTLQPQYKGTPAGIAALNAIDDRIIKLRGLEPAKKIELSGNNGAPIKQNITCEVVFKDYGA